MLVPVTCTSLCWAAFTSTRCSPATAFFGGRVGRPFIFRRTCRTRSTMLRLLLAVWGSSPWPFRSPWPSSAALRHSPHHPTQLFVRPVSRRLGLQLSGCFLRRPGLRVSRFPLQRRRGCDGRPYFTSRWTDAAFGTSVRWPLRGWRTRPSRLLPASTAGPWPFVPGLFLALLGLSAVARFRTTRFVAADCARVARRCSTSCRAVPSRTARG